MFKTKTFTRFRKDENGQYAIMTAIFSLPLLLATSAAVDFSSAASEHKAVKNALDNAVLAAATDNSISTAQKKQLAKTHFRKNYSGRAEISLEPYVKGGLVSMTASGVVPFSISRAIGKDGIKVNTKSSALRSEQNVICVLALSDSEEESIKFSGGLEFFAPNCSVHSNSVSYDALMSESDVMPIAKSFCATGGVDGSFSPYAKGQCLPVEDPYLNTQLPALGDCVSEMKFKKKKNKGRDDDGDDDDDDDEDGGYGPGPLPEQAGSGIEESGNYTGSGATFYPGTYCGGLTVDGRSVTFMPGDYIMLDGALTFKNEAQATAENVTFAFSGDKARLKIESGSNVSVKAPTSGPRKGIAFMEMAIPLEKLKSSENKKKEKKTIANTISSGGALEVLGTVYFPTQALVVEGKDTRMGAKAPATSFIAHTIDLSGDSGSRVQVNVNHRAADLPPILPRAEDGAILVE